MTKLILNDEMAELIRAKASKQGYDDPTAYIFDLVIADEDGDSLAENENVRADFKLAFQQAIQGKTISRAELRRRMAEDEFIHP